MPEWKQKVKLIPGESLKFERSYMKGPLQETDVELYEIVNEKNEVTGNVEVTDHTAIKGFRRTISALQTDAAGNTVIRESWNP